jgi:glycosyltransferase involved in cell wall biosynthesis
MITLIAFSHLRWNFVCQRPQHLMRQLALRFRVLYVEAPLFSAGEPHLEVTDLMPGLQVLVPHTRGQSGGGGGFDHNQISELRRLLAAYLRESRIDDTVAWFFTPMALPLLATMQPCMVVYDCSEEWAVPRAPREWRRREAALMKRADLVLTHGPSLYEAKRALHSNVHHLPSGVDAENFAPRAAARAQAELEVAQAQAAARLLQSIARPRLGYFGVVDQRLDFALLDRLAAERPVWQVVMVGPVTGIGPQALPQRPNIHWLGVQPYARLPHLMAGWDVCLMPFAIGPATQFLSPTKTLEYLAGEKPVVSTALPDVVSLYGDLVRIARGEHEFIEACAALLAEKPHQRSQRLARIVAAVYRTSWQQVGREVERLIAEHLAGGPKPAVQANKGWAAVSSAQPVSSAAMTADPGEGR